MSEPADRLQQAQETGRWTVGALHDHFSERMDTLERHLDERFDAQDEATKRALESAEKAVLKAEHLADTRSEAQNEWRATIGDLMTLKVDRTEYLTAHDTLCKEVAAAVKYQDLESGGKKAAADITARLIASASVLCTVAVLIVTLAHH